MKMSLNHEGIQQQEQKSEFETQPKRTKMYCAVVFSHISSNRGRESRKLHVTNLNRNYCTWGKETIS